MNKTNKSLLVKFLTVVCSLCLSLGLVFGLVGCGDEQAYIVKSELNGSKLVLTYSDGNVVELDIAGKDGVDASACKHTNVQATKHNEVKVGAADACTIDISICNDCGDVVFTKVDHKAENVKDVKEDATCYLGSYEGKKCEYCGWTEGARKDDATNHANAVAIENPLEFQAGVMGVAKINKCTTEWYEEVKICPDCGDIKITTKPATGHTYNKANLVENKIVSGGNDTYTLTGTCVDCSETHTVVALPKLNEATYAKVSGGAFGSDKHKVTYKHTGTFTLKDGAKFTDDTNTYEFNDYAITADGFAELHYITKNVDGAPVNYTLNGMITDYAVGLYNGLLLKGNATDLNCGAEEAAMGGSAGCVFCNTAVDVQVKKAHTGVTVKNYYVDENPCTTEGKHTELWNCTECGDFEVEVDMREHEHELSTADDALVANQDGTFDIKTVCKYCKEDGLLENITLDSTSVRATCGVDGLLKYTPAGSTKTYELTEPATLAHVYEAGKVAVTKDNLTVQYADAAPYINGSVKVKENMACGDTDASLWCPVCSKAIDIVIHRDHIEDTTNSVKPAATCTAGLMKLYCSYADCINKYVDATSTPYYNEPVPAKHTFVVDADNTDTITVSCSACANVAFDSIVIGDASEEKLKVIEAECVSNVQCDQETATKYNKKVWTFTYESVEYKVELKLPVSSHKYGVYTNMPVDPAATTNAAEIIAASLIKSGSPAQTCAQNAEYRFACDSCNQAVDIFVKGSHVQGSNQIVPASCEEGEYWTCSVANCGEKVYTGVKATGHTIKVSAVALDGTDKYVMITCEEECGLNAKVYLKDCDIVSAKNCEDNNYTYAYDSNGSAAGGYTQTFAFSAEKILGIEHDFVEVNEQPVLFTYVVVDGVAVQYNAQNADHANLTKYTGYFCTACKEFRPAA